MDIKGFFMNIERKKLYEKLELFIETKYRQSLLEKLETDKNKKFKGQWIFDLKEIEEKLSFVKYLIPRIREFLKEELGAYTASKKDLPSACKNWSYFSWCLHKAKLHNGRQTCSEKLSKHYKIEKSAIKIEKKK